jgi:hypothetical protein
MASIGGSPSRVTPGQPVILEQCCRRICGLDLASLTVFYGPGFAMFSYFCRAF